MNPPVDQLASKAPRIAIVSTYTPQRCGIATFAADLRAALVTAAPDTEVAVIAVKDLVSGYDYPSEVHFEIDQSSVADYRNTADYINMKEFDLVCLQHEFGIFGGNSGSHVLRFLQNLRMPVVTTFHTVLSRPSNEQREVLSRIAAFSDRVVVMSEGAREFLRRIYDVPADRIVVIPHGVPDMPFLDPSYYKDEFDLVGRKVILTFGLLSRGKGVEYLIEALPAIVAEHPDALLVIAGETHPAVKRREGEAYRNALKSRAAELGIDANVRFLDRFFDQQTLIELISTADVFVTPYLGQDQIVSGVLSYALGAGKAIVSTPYWYAEEVLADGRGRLVPFRDPAAIAREVRYLLSNDVERQATRKSAYVSAREMVWADVARQYHRIFNETHACRAVRPRLSAAGPGLSQSIDTVPLSLGHLNVLTDDTGILQHARFAVPDRDHGYCTDDNARALMVVLMARHEIREGDALLALAARYLSFLQHAFNADLGRFRNFMSYARNWQEDVGSEDSHGRALWALGHAVFEPTRFVGAAMTLFEQALPAMHEIHALRACCFALLGLDGFLRRFAGATEARRMRELLAARVFDRFRGAGVDWPWPEDRLSYANGLMPHALIATGIGIDAPEMVDAGLRSLRWLMDVQTDPAGHFAPIGNDGWYERGSKPARFDQQPIEVQHMVDALTEAYLVTGTERWLDDARLCFDWFLGRNDLHQPLRDAATGGCRDGLRSSGVNQNQGAESTLALLHALIRLRMVSRGRVVAADAPTEIRVIPPISTKSPTAISTSTGRGGDHAREPS